MTHVELRGVERHQVVDVHVPVLEAFPINKKVSVWYGQSGRRNVVIGKHVPSFSRTAMGSVFRDRCVWSSLTTQRFWVCAWRCTKSAAMSCLAPGVTSMDDSLSRSQSSPALMLMEGETNAASSASEPRFWFAVFPVVFVRSARSVIFVSASSSSSPSSSFSSSSFCFSSPCSPFPLP